MNDSPNTTREDRPTVLVIDDDPEMRKSIEQLLATIDLPVRSFESAEDFLSTAPHDQHGCMLLDLQMSGIDLLRQLIRDQYQSPILMVTAHAEVTIAVEALRLGAFDFVEKPYSVQQMLRKVQKAIKQDFDHRSALSLAQKQQQQFDELSPQEREVVDLLSKGKSPKEIADQLDISTSTFDFHRNNVLAKFELNSIVDLVRIIARISGN
jgi:two-component system, LuxR family, response regulator FixJ